MDRKKWSNPEIMELGIKSTKEEWSTTYKPGDKVYKCKYNCGYQSKKQEDVKKHEKHCPGNGTMLPGEGEGLVPTFS